jgi:hypothetical protein
VVVKLAPVPLAGLPPVAVQENVYGLVPPVAVAVNVTGVPMVPVVGPLIVTARATGATVTLWLDVVVAVLASATVRVTVKVPLAE